MNVNVKPRAGKAAASQPIPKPRRTRVSGMDRALQVLEYLREIGAPSGAYAIAKAIGAPLSTTYLVIDELVERELLIRRGEGHVWLGPRLYLLGLAYQRSLDFLAEAGHEMHELCRASGETVQICGRDRDHMVVLAMADGPGHFRVMSEVGTRVPLNWTASGRLLVGHLPDGERLAIFRHSAKASPTQKAETNPRLLSDLSRKAFDERLSVQISETDFLVSCVASPIVDATGACVATISIVLPAHKVEARRSFYAKAVREASARVERKLGWRSVAA
ncbi:MAG: IclR family transcriptional regulator [Rhizobiales bacterium]|nr:IclR family transcriptional regulator [Hyphomicrobiales bacterium]MBN9010864.1 IclR family transcriptional regulator [Hyphomicrobiales bacterium]